MQFVPCKKMYELPGPMFSKRKALRCDSSELCPYCIEIQRLNTALTEKIPIASNVDAIDVEFTEEIPSE